MKLTYLMLAVLTLGACSHNIDGDGLVLDANIISEACSETQVEIFMRSQPKLPVRDFCMVEAKGEGANTAAVFQELRRQAGLLGADGIYKIEIHRYSSSREVVYATAIGFKYEAKRSRA